MVRTRPRASGRRSGAVEVRANLPARRPGSGIKILAALTRGRYSNVWTPLGERELRIDDEHGGTLKVEQLSGGTREQLFLAVRMAMIRELSQKGLELPMILDDVLVNFDQLRTEAAVDTLLEFSEENRQNPLLHLPSAPGPHVRDPRRGTDLAPRPQPRRQNAAPADPQVQIRRHGPEGNQCRWGRHFCLPALQVPGRERTTKVTKSTKALKTVPTFVLFVSFVAQSVFLCGSLEKARLHHQVTKAPRSFLEPWPLGLGL